MEKIQKEQPQVVIKNQDKLYIIGFQDGKEKTTRNLEKNLPTDMEFMNPRGPKLYIWGFIDGSEEAIKEYTEKENQSKTR